MNYYSSYRGNNYSAPKRQKKSVKKIVATVVLTLLAAVLVWWLFFRADKTPNEVNAPVDSLEQQSVAQPAKEETAQLPDLQPVVDKYIGSHNGTYAVKITDVDGKSLAEVNGDKQFFTASIYKLYVAYVGYQKIDDGTYNLNDSYLNGYTRGKCLDAMIRDSYSPCGEKMWAELGKESVTTKMKSYGLTNTSLVGLTTSANDAAIILRKIETGEGLSKASQAAYLDSMKTQAAKYRRGLPSGFSEATVYNKVGWNLDQEWHDTSIVKLNNGKTVIVSVMTTNAGYQNVAGLGAAIQKALQ